jgi:hypothetical protein
MTDNPDLVLYWFMADVNADGIMDLIATDTECSIDNAIMSDYYWNIYLGKSNKTYSVINGVNMTYDDWKPVKEFSVGMQLDRYWVGKIPELNNQYGVLCLILTRGRDSKCFYHAIVIENEQFKVVKVGEEMDQDENYDRVMARIKRTGAPVTYQAKAADFLKTGTGYILNKIQRK